jgi:hypothetical protein
MSIRLYAAGPALCLALSLLTFPLLAGAPAKAPMAELKPRSYAFLIGRSSAVAAGTVTSVSMGLMSDHRKAIVEVDGLFKGRLRKKLIEVSWNDLEFEETAYQDGARVILFLSLLKDSTYAQVSPGISCWPVEKISLQGRTARAVEYGFPLDLITGLPSGVMKETSEVEKSLNFQVPKRKKWILVDKLLPPLRPWKTRKRR